MSEKLGIGRLVRYRLSKSDVESILARRERSRDSVEDCGRFFGNTPREGEIVPAIVTAMSPGVTDHFNGQAFLDGNDTHWITSVHEGTEPGTWHWPVRS